MFITYHAADRFAARIAPGMTREQAKAVLIDAQRSAEPTGERTEEGHAVWRIRQPFDALLVTKHDPRYGPVCVTVLHPGMPDERAALLAEAEEEVMAAVARATPERPEERSEPVEQATALKTPKKAKGEHRRLLEEARREAMARKLALWQAADVASYAVRLWARGDDPGEHLAKLREHVLAGDPRISAVIALCSGAALGGEGGSPCSGT